MWPAAHTYFSREGNTHTHTHLMVSNIAFGSVFSFFLSGGKRNEIKAEMRESYESISTMGLDPTDLRDCRAEGFIGRDLNS